FRCTPRRADDRRCCGGRSWRRELSSSLPGGPNPSAARGGPSAPEPPPARGRRRFCSLVRVVVGLDRAEQILGAASQLPEPVGRNPILPARDPRVDALGFGLDVGAVVVAAAIVVAARCGDAVRGLVLLSFRGVVRSVVLLGFRGGFRSVVGRRAV